jgi:hypothetical protein
MKKLFSASLQLFIGLSLLLCTASCSETPKGIIKKKQAALNSTLDSLNALGAKVSDQPLSSDKLSLPANAPALDVDDIGNYAYGGAGNAQLFTVQDLLDPEAKSPSMHFFLSRAAWQNVKAMVKDAKFSGTEQDALKALKGFSDWRYAVVIRVRSVRAPGPQSQPGIGAFSTGTFLGGSIEGDVLLYDLDGMAFLGSFPFSAQSSENVETTTYGASAGTEVLQQQLDKDFADKIKEAVFFGLVDRLPKDRIAINGNLQRRLETRKGK